MTKGPRIREIDPHSPAEVEIVAARMRETLVEVLGEETGRSMYTMDWLIQRVRWHLDPNASTGAVFLSENGEGQVTGHTIVRIDADEAGKTIGLFSTTFVEPGSRNRGVARGLLARGERWMIERGMTEAVTYTDQDNAKLQKLYIGAGYALSAAPKGFVKLSKPLCPRS